MAYFIGTLVIVGLLLCAFFCVRLLKMIDEEDDFE